MRLLSALDAGCLSQPPETRSHMTRNNLLKSALLLVLGALVGCGGPVSKTPDYAIVTFDVDVPISTPSTGIVYIIGNHANLGNDSNDAGLKLARVSDTKFSGQSYLPKGAQIFYRVRLKDPQGASASELDANSVAVAPRTLNVGTDDTSVPVTVSQWNFEGVALPPSVTFLVTVPSNTPANADVCVTGNAPELGPWKPDNTATKLTKQADGTYKITIGFTSVNAGDTIQYKTTRCGAGWVDVEKKADGSELDNRTLKLLGGPQSVSYTVAKWADLPAP